MSVFSPLLVLTITSGRIPTPETRATAKRPGAIATRWHAARTYIVTITGIGVLGSAQAGRRKEDAMYYFFDFRGAYLGYLDGSGQFFDESGVQWGRLGNGGKVLGGDGRERGYLNAQGCFFEPNGACRGYLRDMAAQPPMAELR